MVQKLKQGSLAEFSALITSCRHFERPTQGSPAVCWAGISSPVPSKAVFPLTEEEIKYNLSPVKRTVLPREMLTTRGTQLPCNSQRFLIILGSFHAITGDGFFTSNRKEHFLKKDVFTLIKQWRSAGVFCVFHLFFNVNLALRLKKASYPHISRCQHGDTERQQQHVPGRPQPCNVAQAYQDLHSQAAPHSIHHFQWLFFITLSEDSHLKLYVMCCVIRANYTVSP